MSFIITGYTSEIAKETIKQFKLSNSDIKIITVGRTSAADIYCDFSDYSSILRFTKDILPTIELTHLFVNHGILFGKKALNLRENQIREYMMVNCYSFIAILEAINYRNKLNTVVMSSISGKEGSYDPIYAATKAGVDSFRYKARTTLPPTSRLNFISPGIVSDAGMTVCREDVDNLEILKNITPSQKFSDSKEIASMVTFLLSTPGNINFQDIAINGGMSLNK